MWRIPKLRGGTLKSAKLDHLSIETNVFWIPHLRNPHGYSSLVLASPYTINLTDNH